MSRARLRAAFHECRLTGSGKDSLRGLHGRMKFYLSEIHQLGERPQLGSKQSFPH